MTRKGRDEETGMILVNVLMFVAIASGLVLLMINREEFALDRGLRMREAARAVAVARGGELSALVALRRDMIQAPDADHAREPWGAIAERGAAIAGGTFDLAVADASGRFNINTLRSGIANATILFQAIGLRAGLPNDRVLQVIEFVRLRGPVTDLGPLRVAGIAPESVARLEAMVTALPADTTINLNSADEELMALLFNDPLVAQRLVAVRARQGFLTPKDLADQRVSLPAGAGFTSNYFWVRARATIGGTSQQIASLVERRTVDRRPEAVAVARWRNAAVPPGAPGFGN